MRVLTRIAFVALSALLATNVTALLAPAQGDKDAKIPVRHLKFTPKDPMAGFKLGGRNKLTALDDAGAVEALLGKDSVKSLIDAVDFAKEKIVMLSWSTSGPPDGMLAHEVKGTGKDRKLQFYVQAPNAQTRGERLRLALDFFAVPKDVAVAFDPKERN
jgi:hypothetical protein